MKLRVHPLADADFDDAYKWYAAEHADLAQQFSRAVNEALKKILDGPTRPQEIEPGVRRCLTETFPYALIYRVSDDEVYLICIAHLKRRPGFWHKRLKR